MIVPICAWLLALIAPTLARADLLGDLVMPGELIEGHAKVEQECSQCHRPFQKTKQRALCLECHEEIASDVAAWAGFHGRPSLREDECRTCHTDHEGRGADIIGLDPQIFDHDLTDFPLRGGHSGEACLSCHAAGSRYREALHDCLDCHAEHDPHGGRLGEHCDTCHSAEGWAVTGFDHSRTHFALKGRHEDVPCAACHPSERYRDTPLDCGSCHWLNDRHNGRFGRRCEDCHIPTSWRQLIFDHDADTKYALRGAHKAAACNDCHTGKLYEDALPSTCVSCHRTDDEHRGRFGQKCGTCHTETDWTTGSFDHDKGTRFPLRGSHAKIACTVCHQAVIGKKGKDRACRACHLEDDVHAGAEGSDCGRCHTDIGWAKDIAFDHDLARFPLLGLHAVVPCEECHAGSAFARAPADCQGCHGSDDFHDGRLGPACESCHNPNSWALWRFDHDLQTRFPLEGAHADLRCYRCHVARVEDDPELPTDCAGCHRTDDIHAGGFGSNCSRCHSNISWRNVRPGT